MTPKLLRANMHTQNAAWNTASLPSSSMRKVCPTDPLRVNLLLAQSELCQPLLLSPHPQLVVASCNAVQWMNLRLKGLEPWPSVEDPFRLDMLAFELRHCHSSNITSM